MSDDASTLMPAASPAKARPDAVPALTILYHPDIARVGERAYLDGATHEVSRNTTTFSSGRTIEDRYVSRSPLKITRAHTGVQLEAEAAARCIANGRPIAGAAGAAWQTFDRDTLSRGVVVEVAERVVLLLHLALPRNAGAPSFGLVGDSDAMAQVRDDIARVADLAVPVLLRGETGSGKELVAHAIHTAAKESGRSFVAVNVAAIPPTTAASELFGHQRGAFTGASHDHEGLFARADGGTLFLDEIGETPNDVQPMLLRVLETSEVTPLGSAKARKVSVRLVAATDADLENQIAEAGFRAALFHRLAGYQLFIPPLRERRDDIGRLLIHFLREELQATGDLDKLLGQREAQSLWLPTELVARLCRYNWPGNVRQLRNAARQLAISSRGAAEVRIDSALERLLASTPPAAQLATPVAVETKSRRDPSDISDEELLTALRANQWRAVGAATQLGVSRSTLYALIDKSKRIRKAKDIPENELRKAFDACGGELDVAAAELEVSRRALKLRIAELGWEDN